MQFIRLSPSDTAITSDKNDHSWYGFPCLQRFLGISINHALACTAASHPVLCHTGTTLCPQLAKPFKSWVDSAPGGCGEGILHPLSRAVHFSWYCHLVMK